MTVEEWLKGNNVKPVEKTVKMKPLTAEESKALGESFNAFANGGKPVTKAEQEAANKKLRKYLEG